MEYITPHGIAFCENNIRLYIDFFSKAVYNWIVKHLHLGGVMAHIHFLGTCSGTEPMEGMHHASLLISSGDMNYWFDAGENCSYRAFLSGVDVLKTRAVFLSHMHIDHTGGLADLFFCMEKMIGIRKEKLIKDNTVDIIAPDLELIHAIKSVAASNTTSHASLLFQTNETRTFDGVVYEDENIRVSALHNTHLGEDGSRGWHAYSFLIEVDNKRIVHSGDVGSITELDPLIADGCDLLIMETGHHKVAAVCDYAKQKGIKKLRFHHHGREIINDRAAMEALVASYPYDYAIAYDGLKEDI